MDIEIELNKLILEYGINQPYPRFEIKLRCIDLIKKLLSPYLETNEKVLFLAANQTDIECTLCELGDVRIGTYLWDINKKEQLSFDFSAYSLVLDISREGKEDRAELLLENKIDSKSLYSYFVENGLTVEGDFYDIFQVEYMNYVHGNKTNDYKDADINRIFFEDRINWDKSVEIYEKQYYLQKIIMDCILAKDFLLMEEYVNIYIKAKYLDGFKYQSFLKQVKILLQDIKKRLHARHKKDILIFWLDALEYSEDKEMPFLKSLNKKGLVFENAYTVTPYTQATAKTILCKKYVVDDKSYRITKISKSNSELIMNLQQSGYRTIYYGSLNYFENTIKSKQSITYYTTASQIYWQCMRDLLNSGEPLFSIMHELTHTHAPYISLGLRGDEYIGTSNMLTFKQSELETLNGQILPSRIYLDQQLAFYSSFFSEMAYKIYMSDHGHTVYGKFHTIFKVVQRSIPPQVISKLYSYINFDHLICYILQEKERNIDRIVSDYAVIQDVDYYYGPQIKGMLTPEKFREEYLFGYQGIVDGRHIFLKYNNGKTVLLNIENQSPMITRDEEGKLRNLLHTLKADVYTESKFQYSKYVYKAMENYQHRMGDVELKKKEVIRQIFEEIPKMSVLAVRGGGEHSLHLFSELEWELRSKIKYIIDQDKNCVASYCGIPIIKVDQLEEYQVDTVVVSSFAYEKEWTEELQGKYDGLTIISIYKNFRLNGIQWNGDFYSKSYINEDFDVGFPNTVFDDKG